MDLVEKEWGGVALIGLAHNIEILRSPASAV
jgi:hypothetical protein